MPTARSVRRPHIVGALITHGVAPFELAVICEVFGFARPEILDPWPYEVVLASPDGSRVRTNQGFAIDGVQPLRALDRSDTIIVPAWSGDAPLRPCDPMLETLCRAH